MKLIIIVTTREAEIIIKVNISHISSTSTIFAVGFKLSVRAAFTTSAFSKWASKLLPNIILMLNAEKFMN